MMNRREMHAETWEHDFSCAWYGAIFHLLFPWKLTKINKLLYLENGGETCNAMKNFEQITYLN